MPSYLTRSSNEYVDIVEARCGNIAPVTAIVKTVKQAAKYLKDGNWFFCTNCRKSKLVYQKGTTEVEDLTGITSLKEIDVFKAKAKSWYVKGSAFMDGGCFHVAKHQYSNAIFLFHQALENYLTAVLLYRTGYRERTHNLSKLIRYCSLWVPEITGVFAEIDRRDQNLLKKLQRAYNDSRYKEGYSITPEEVGKVMRIFKDIHPYIRDIMQLTE
jgi:HEPN domain-containing protein